jgi:toxin-antitoxin system PIN domain toxin
VKLPDANLLIYAVNEDAPDHVPARTWLASTLSGVEPVGLAWLALVAFVRITTRPGVFAHPLATTSAFEIIEGWLARPNVFVLHPTERHVGILRGLLEPLGIAGDLTNDAHLAALAIEYGAELCSADSDFGRFQGLRWTNPLKS